VQRRITSVNDVAVSVLIVNYNSGEHLANVLRALASQSLPEFEAIVLDNGSADLSFSNAQAVVGEDGRFRFCKTACNLGFAAGINFAATMAQGAWLALLNPDAEPAPDWLEQLIAATRRHPDVAIFGSTQVDASDPHRLDGAGDHYFAIGIPWRGGHGWPAEKLPAEGEVFAPCGAACLIRADVFRKADGFDERFFCYVEDVDLAFRLRLIGHRCIQVSAAVVRHVGAISSRQVGSLFAQASTRNLLWCFVKCMPGPMFWPLLPLHIVALLLRPVRTGTFRPVWRGIRDALCGLPGVWASRRILQRSRLTPWWRIALVLSWNPIAYLRREPRSL
jgi:GT2 family glycosyltransferase